MIRAIVGFNFPSISTMLRETITRPLGIVLSFTKREKQFMSILDIETLMDWTKRKNWIYDRGEKKMENQDDSLLLLAKRTLKTRNDACSIFTARNGHTIKNWKNKWEKGRGRRIEALFNTENKNKIVTKSIIGEIYIFSFTMYQHKCYRISNRIIMQTTKRISSFIFPWILHKFQYKHNTIYAKMKWPWMTHWSWRIHVRELPKYI